MRILQHAPTRGVMVAAGDAVPTLFVQTTIKEFVRHVSRQTPSIFYTSWPRVYLGQVMPSNTKCFYRAEGITENSSPNQGVAARLDMKTFASLSLQRRSGPMMPAWSWKSDLN